MMIFLVQKRKTGKESNSIKKNNKNSVEERNSKEIDIIID